MHRRRFLHSLASGGVVLTAGCMSRGQDSERFNFGIANWRPNRYDADVSLRKNDETAILYAEVDVPAYRSTDEKSQGLFLRNLTTVTNDDVINARVTIDETEFDTQYDVTCVNRENAENNLFLHIYPDEIEFSGSKCLD